MPGSEGSFNADKTVVDAVPPVHELQPIQPVDHTFAQQEQVTPYVPTPGATPYVPPAVPLMGGTAGLTPAGPAGPQPGSHGMPPSSGATRSRGSSVALIVVFVAVGVVGLALLVALYLYLR